MKHLALLTTLIGSAAFAQAPVAVYDFNGNLYPVYTNGFAGVIEKRVKPISASFARLPSFFTAPTYTSATVGGSARQVGTFVIDPDGDATNGRSAEFFRVFGGASNNGGGSYTNQYTLVYDVRVDSLDAVGNRWFNFLNTTADQNNDGDMFFDLTRGYGVSGNYDGLALFQSAQFQRVVIVCDLTLDNLSVATERMKIYVDGTLANTVSIGGLDGRHAVYSKDTGATDGYTHFDLFGDESAEMGAGALAQFAMFDRALTDAEVAGLGVVGTALAPGSQVIFNGSLSLGDYSGDVDPNTAGIEEPFPAQIDVEVKDTSGSTIAVYENLQVNEIGQIAVLLPGNGTYVLGVKASQWRAINDFDRTFTTFLNRNYTVTATAGAASGILNLVNGDVNKDGEVGAADFSALAAAYDAVFGDASYSLDADLNKDGEVGAADFSVLAASYDEVADF